jgi:CheY-like chemotaxis protein
MATILIVDDRSENRDYLTALLQHRGHRTLEAGDGAKALELARAEHPDLVISDVVMPVMDGYELARRLSIDPTLAATPVICYSAVFDPHESERLSGTSDVVFHLAKPAEPEAILGFVDRVLAQTSPRSVAPLSTEAYDREHLRIVSDELARQVAELEAANRQLELQPTARTRSGPAQGGGNSAARARTTAGAPGQGAGPLQQRAGTVRLRGLS